VIAVGNDVVDLLDAEAVDGAQHPGFDARVLTDRERAWLARQQDVARARWTLWSAKEACWKLMCKLKTREPFSPRRFETEPRAGGLQVRYGDAALHVDIVRRGACLHAIARRAVDATLVLEPTVVDCLAADPSELVRRCALHGVAHLLGCAPTELRVEKQSGIPRVLRSGRPTDVDLSLSHHGRYVAFVASVARGQDGTRLVQGTSRCTQKQRYITEK
jgi:phosphopantetheinyl transferase (holo-ACP synthase)